MLGLQNRNVQNIERHSHGCLGRTVNFFDMTDGISGKRMLTDKPHFDGFSFSRSRSDVTTVLSSADKNEDEMIVEDIKRSYSNKNGNGTPMKTLIAQEMTKEVDSRYNPPNVVAKLMGLDSLPLQQPNSATRRGQMKGYSRHSSSNSGVLPECWGQDHNFLDKQILYETCQHHKQNQCRDVCEIWQQSQKMNVRDSSPLKGKYNENVDEKRMALFRQKFMEAKCLATNCQSKEFRDAIDVLSSNNDLLLKFLDEPNSMFSPQLHHMESIPTTPEAKRITVLKPSKLIHNEKLISLKSDKQAKKLTQMGQATGYKIYDRGYLNNFSIQKVDEYPAQPTRIVVLKPSPGMTRDCKAVGSPPSSSPRILHCEDIYDELHKDEARESRKLAKEITCHMRDSVMGRCRDEAVLSSVFSNGYIDDYSSFNKLGNEYVDGNLSDSEIMSPTSRLSWDYTHKFGSPYSSASCSRISCSPESSVCREAKKRLSERWTMMALNGSPQEQKDTRRSSSTLGEMLALSDVKKTMRSEGGVTNKPQEPRGSTSYISSNSNKEEDVANSPKGLLRSKSLPVSSTAFSTRVDAIVSICENGKTELPKELSKGKNSKSSLKGRVSGLFFSRNRRTNKEKSAPSQFKDELRTATPETQDSPVPLPGNIDDYATQCDNTSAFEVCLSPGLQGSSMKTTNQDLVGMDTKEGLISQERVLSVAKLLVPGNASENQDQPSPISVLEPLPEEDDNININPGPCGNMKLDHLGAEMSLKSNLIGKSPPIGSIARTLSWDDSVAEMGTQYTLKTSLTDSQAQEEEQDWLSFVETLLSAAGLEGNVQIDTFYARWHSPESPLDPSLRDKYANLNDKELLHEAKRRQRRSNRKLVFDCVNAALVELTGNGSDRRTSACSCCNSHDRMKVDASTILVWSQIKEWFCSELRCSTGGSDGDSNSLVVERVVRKEVVGKGWTDNMRMELDTLGREIEGKLLEELVEEAVVEFTDRQARP
ncbi:hypothetical protein K2173_025687 [Erythroxylum novogranatense]|uniref:DUF4378 domain-containing protein n=1 Tax=Erythroxylum novogranatense TaxID=1862640 RepID=A0AAV8SBI4_9ROSI|nr:hypothetical protein K2173_025687 [Erythroxylum novogranatense]